MLFVGALIAVPIPLVFQMVFIEEVFSLLFVLPYTWMVCWLLLSSVELVVIGIICLLVACVLPMILFCLHHAHLC